MGFVNEYRAERTAAALHSRVRHTAVVRRDGAFAKIDVTDLVPGDVIRLTLGEVVPADVRLIDVSGLECNESILTGESTASEKSPQPVPADAELADSADLAFMGTIVSAGEGIGVVYATGRTPSSAGSPRAWVNGSPRPTSRSACAGSPICCCGWRSR